MSGSDSCRRYAVIILGVTLITLVVCITVIVNSGHDVPPSLMAAGSAMIGSLCYVVYGIGKEGSAGLNTKIDTLQHTADTKMDALQQTADQTHGAVNGGLAAVKADLAAALAVIARLRETPGPPPA